MSLLEINMVVILQYEYMGHAIHVERAPVLVTFILKKSKDHVQVDGLRFLGLHL